MALDHRTLRAPKEHPDFGGPGPPKWPGSRESPDLGGPVANLRAAAGLWTLTLAWTPWTACRAVTSRRVERAAHGAHTSLDNALSRVLPMRSLTGALPTAPTGPTATDLEDNGPANPDEFPK